jgi:hypothetical protein
MLLKLVMQSNGFYALPQELMEKSVSYSWQLILGVVVCLALIAVSKMNNGGILLHLANGNLKLTGLKTLYKENLSLSKLPSLLLLFNFILASSIILFLFFEDQLVSSLPLQLILISPLVLFVWDYLGFTISTLITGEFNLIAEPRLIRLFGAQLLGVLIWSLLLAHILYPDARLEVELVLCYIILTEFVLRILRSILLVSRSGAAWYYIILYFCTLEILPLFIAYSMFVGVS